MKEFSAAVFVIFGFLATIVLLMVAGGFVVATLWGWFIVPTFGMKELTIAQAMGVSLMIGYFRNKANGKKSSMEDNIAIMGEIIINLLVTLGLGYLVHLFM